MFTHDIFIFCTFGRNITKLVGILLIASYQVSHEFRLSPYWWCFFDCLMKVMSASLLQYTVILFLFLINMCFFGDTLKLHKYTIPYQIFIYSFISILNYGFLFYLMGYNMVLCPHHSLSISLLSVMTRYSRLILYILYPSLGIFVLQGMIVLKRQYLDVLIVFVVSLTLSVDRGKKMTHICITCITERHQCVCVYKQVFVCL